MVVDSLLSKNKSPLIETNLRPPRARGNNAINHYMLLSYLSKNDVTIKIIIEFVIDHY